MKFKGWHPGYAACVSSLTMDWLMGGRNKLAVRWMANTILMLLGSYTNTRTNRSLLHSFRRIVGTLNGRAFEGSKAEHQFTFWQMT